MSELRIGVVGAGYIAREHLKALQPQKELTLCGVSSRTRARAEQLAAEFGRPNVYDTAEELIEKGRADVLLVLVSADQMFAVVKQLCPFGLPLFIEKPPGLSPIETGKLADLAEHHGVANMVGFNRRYYSVFHKGLAVIKDHGALLGVTVEGHERFWKIAAQVSPEIRDYWIYANSTHTIDLLRFFGGEPRTAHAVSSAQVEKRGDQFSAVLAFESGALGNYSSHWYSPGGWGARLYGEGVTVEFRPLENGRWVDADFCRHEITPDEVDLAFKPGFFRQMENFSQIARGARLEWPAQDLRQAQKTMELAGRIQSG